MRHPDVSLLTHLGTQNVRAIPTFLADSTSQSPGSLVGVTVGLPGLKAESASERLDDFGPTSACTLAEPETHRLLLEMSQRGRQRNTVSYLQFLDPAARAADFVDAVLEEQAQHAPDALITPWLTHGTTATSAELEATREFAILSSRHPLTSEYPLLMGAGVAETMVRDDDARSEFCAELLDCPELPLYLRVHVISPGSYGQYSDGAVLRGLAELVSDISANGREVILPQSGLVGWLMTAFGSRCFGTGITSSLQRFAPAVGRGGGGRRLNWYFAPGLLGFVLRDELRLLENIDGFELCGCPYCPQLDLRRGGSWDPDTAGLHYLWWCRALADESRAADFPREVVSSRLARAAALWQRVQRSQVRLDQRSKPLHLESWSAAVGAA